jgi:hypothetical protein
MDLTIEEKKDLLRIARDSIAAALGEKVRARSNVSSKSLRTK